MEHTIAYIKATGDLKIPLKVQEVSQLYKSLPLQLLKYKDRR